MKHLRDMTDDECWHYLCKATYQSIAEGLLRGNDTGCFSTEQYCAAYLARTSIAGEPGSFVHRNLTLDQCRSHLWSIPRVVVEVRPDVWFDAREKEL